MNWSLSVSSDRETRTKIVRPKALSQAATISIKITIAGEFAWRIKAWNTQDRIVASNLKRANKTDWRWRINLTRDKIKKEKAK